MTEEEWLAELARECRCCPECVSLPCDGCQQGALCDETCWCSDEDDREDVDRDDEDEATP